MREGWSLKEAAAVLGMHERKVGQALDPALEKIAKLWEEDATKTMTTILAAVAALPPKGATQKPPMTDAEIAWLEHAREGRFNTTDGKAVRACR